MQKPHFKANTGNSLINTKSNMMSDMFGISTFVEFRGPQGVVLGCVKSLSWS